MSGEYKMERQFYDEWEGFKPGRWSNTSINLRDFIQKNFTPYDGDDSFLTGPTEATTKLWEQVMELSKKEREAGGVLDMDTKIVSTITSHGPGYLNKDLEKIVGFQTDKPFKRSLQPFGGIRMAMNACEQNGYTVDPEVVKIFTEYRKTHNQGVFDAYTPEMKLARHAAIITGLPDAYGRGRIIGDYRRVALYGIDYLVEDKKDQLATSLVRMTSKNIRLREELSEQIRALANSRSLARSTDMISHVLLRTLRKLSSGCTSATLLLLRSRTVLQCHLAELLHLSISTSREIWTEVSSQSRRLRSLLTTSS